MTHTSQIRQAMAAVDEEPLCLPLAPDTQAPLIPLHAVWTSLTPPQQQRLFHHLVTLCCGLLHPREGRSPMEDAYDPQ